MLTVSQLSKSFAGRALFDDVSLQVNRGESDWITKRIAAGSRRGGSHQKCLTHAAKATQSPKNERDVQGILSQARGVKKANPYQF
jgi:hypothetical protein